MGASQDKDSQTEDLYRMETTITDNTSYTKKRNAEDIGPNTNYRNFSGAFPVPPVRLNRGIGASSHDNHDALETRTYNIKMNIDLRKHTTRAINPGEKFKSTIAILKRSDPNLLILPLTLSSSDTILH